MKQREFKFRMWSTEFKNFFVDTSDTYECLRQQLCGEEDHTDLIFQQFTGMFDKNGKEIYEGDIIKYWVPHFDERVPRIDDVRFVSGCFIPDIWRTTVDDCEIIGNIFETPELLDKRPKAVTDSANLDACF